MLIGRRHRALLVAAAVLTYLLVVLGGIVCATNSSQGCPDWPACYGQLVPPRRMDSILEYSHRVLAALTSLFIVASALVGWRGSRSIRWVRWPPVIAVALLAAVIAFGALTVLHGLGPGLAGLDLGLALLVLALMLSAAVVAFSPQRNPDLPDRLAFRSPLARLALLALVSTFIVLVSGVLIASSSSIVRCLGWSLYDGPLPPADRRSWLQLARGVLVGITGVLVLALATETWYRQRWAGAIRWAATLVGSLFLIETGLGAVLHVSGSVVFLQAIWVATAAAFWAVLVVVTVLVGLAPELMVPAEKG